MGFSTARLSRSSQLRKRRTGLAWRKGQSMVAVLVFLAPLTGGAGGDSSGGIIALHRVGAGLAPAPKMRYLVEQKGGRKARPYDYQTLKPGEVFAMLVIW